MRNKISVVIDDVGPSFSHWGVRNTAEEETRMSLNRITIAMFCEGGAKWELCKRRPTAEKGNKLETAMTKRTEPLYLRDLCMFYEARNKLYHVWSV
jgi:hypothetical protein